MVTTQRFLEFSPRKLGKWNPNLTNMFFKGVETTNSFSDFPFQLGDVPFQWRFNSSPLKHVGWIGWKTSLSYWGQVSFQGRTVKLWDEYHLLESF